MTDGNGSERKMNLCGGRIRELRKGFAGRGISQVVLAARLQAEGGNLDRLAVSRIERGQRAISDRELVWLASALKTEVGFLVCGSRSARQVAEEMRREQEMQEEILYAAEDT